MEDAATSTKHLDWQGQPPRGWNSYDAYGSSVTESQMLANSQALHDRLGPLGFDLITLDYCWSHPDPGPVANPDQGPDLSPPLAMDRHGRLLPAVERFPAAVGNRGLKPIGDALHARGQRFGLHMMRGIPRQAVMAKCPVLGGGGAVAEDIADASATCNWLDQMVGVKTDHPAGQAYYDSVIDLYASWGVDYIKADDLAATQAGYADREIEAIRRAIDRTGRPIVLSLSPGPAPVHQAEHLRQNANLWRMSPDFWDEWGKLRSMFALCARWASQVDRPDRGGWPDCDMIPIGPISQNGPHGEPRRSRFTPDETRTMLNLWGIFRSPLILGGDLTRLNEAEWSILADPMYLDAHRHGRRPTKVLLDEELEVWQSTDSDGKVAFVAIFNLTDADLEIDSNPGLRDHPGLAKVRPPVGTLPAHGSTLFRIT